MQAAAITSVTRIHELVKDESDSHSTSAHLRMGVETFYNGEFDPGSG